MSELETQWHAAGEAFSAMYHRFLEAERYRDTLREQLVKAGKDPRESLKYRARRKAAAKIARLYMRAGDHSGKLYAAWLVFG